MAAKRRSRILKTDSTQVFYTDIQTDDMLYGALIRSEETGRKVTGLYLDGIVPKEYVAFTAKDIKGQNLITTEDTTIPVFAEVVSYPGDPIGILVGPNEQLVQDYLDNIHIQYEELPTDELTEKEIPVDESSIIEADADSENTDSTISTPDGEAENHDMNSEVHDTHQDQPDDSDTDDFDEADGDDENHGDDGDDGDYLDDDILGDGIPEEALLQKYDEPPFPEPEGPVIYQRVVEAGPVDDYFEEAPFHLANSYANRIYCPTCGELSGALVTGTSRTVTFYTPTQWASHLRQNASAVTGHKSDDIKINRTICGAGATNAVWYNTLLCCQAAVAAQCTQKPVKLTMTPAEQRKYIEHSPQVSIIHHAAFLEDGTIASIKTRIMVEVGSGSPFVSQLIDRLAIAALGACKPLAQQVIVQAVKTDTAPTAASMQGADSLAFFALEALFQEIALATQQNPFDIHLRNFFNAGRNHEFTANRPRMVHPISIDTTVIVPLFEKITETSCFYRRYAAYNTVPLTKDCALHPDPVRGIGMANSFEGHGYYGSAFGTLKQKLELTLEENESVTIHAREPSRSITAIWKKLISQELNINESKISFDPDYALSDELELPETAKGNISIQTQLIKKCCTAIQRQRSKDPLPLSVKKALTKQKNTVWKRDTFSGSPYYSVSWGTCVVELEIDSLAYEVNIRNIWIALDIGSVLNKAAAESSILHACHEILRNLITHRPIQSNDIHITLLESNTEPKQIGQVMYSILPAAFANALSQALGRQITTLPVTDDTLYRMIQENADIITA